MVSVLQYGTPEHAEERRMTEVVLTQYSHGAGCDYKISPQLLDGIFKKLMLPEFPTLWWTARRKTILR